MLTPGAGGARAVLDTQSPCNPPICYLAPGELSATNIKCDPGWLVNHTPADTKTQAVLHRQIHVIFTFRHMHKRFYRSQMKIIRNGKQKLGTVALKIIYWNSHKLVTTFPHDFSFDCSLQALFQIIFAWLPHFFNTILYFGIWILQVWSQCFLCGIRY